MDYFKLLKLLLCFYLVKQTTGNDIGSTEYWNNYGHEKLDEKIAITLQKTLTAKNVIIFLGAGLSQSTITATRLAYKNESLAFEEFPWSGIAKTYCIDKTVPDAACAGTAILSGVKTKSGLIGMTPDTIKNDCDANKDTTKQLKSIAKWAIESNKATGFVTNLRVTSGVAASLYAHVPNNKWESDVDVNASGCSSNEVSDIARQLIYSDVGKELKVIFGGGRKNLLPANVNDEENNLPGVRQDGLNLIEEWKMNRNGNATYISTFSEMKNLNTPQIDYLLGLFEYDNMRYNIDVNSEQLTEEPPLITMVHYAMEMLQKPEHKNGFFLLVEDGLINEAHKKNMPIKAVDQVLQFSKAMSMATMMTKKTDTLILSLADVASSLQISGTSAFETDVFNANEKSDIDEKAYSMISYANGPSYDLYYGNGGRNDADIVIKTQENDDKLNIRYPAAIPMSEAENSGSDITVYASGPWGYLFTGSYEQNFIAHAVGYAACLNNYCSAANQSIILSGALTFFILIFKVFI